METEKIKKVFKVTVDTGGSLNEFTTHQDNIFENLKFGNEEMIFLKTINNGDVAIPTRFMVTHKEIE